MLEFSICVTSTCVGYLWYTDVLVHLCASMVLYGLITISWALCFCFMICVVFKDYPGFVVLISIYWIRITYLHCYLCSISFTKFYEDLSMFILLMSYTVIWNPAICFSMQIVILKLEILGSQGQHLRQTSWLSTLLLAGTEHQNCY